MLFHLVEADDANAGLEGLGGEAEAGLVAEVVDPRCGNLPSPSILTGAMRSWDLP